MSLQAMSPLPPKPQPIYRALYPGDPAPWFKQRTSNNPTYAFDAAAGRFIVLCFFGSGADPTAKVALRAVEEGRHRFDDDRLSFFGVSIDPSDEVEGRLRQSLPGIRFFWDFDEAVSRRFGALPENAESAAARRFWMVLDPTLRVIATYPLAEFSALFAALDALPAPDAFAGFEVPAPILVLPQVLEPELCRCLIDRYEQAGGVESGFMRQVDGHTVLMHDPHHKVRRDHVISDKNIIEQLQVRVRRRIVPEIRKVHHFEATRMERYIVACYDADEGGHFRPHRDNTTPATAHRCFAVSINLNADFNGGEVGFPEYGRRTYKAPPGGAVVFSCSLLHAVSPVTSGRRYVFLPFLYGEAAVKHDGRNGP